MFKRFLKDRRGATAIEYAMIVAVVSLAIVGGVGMLMNSIGNNFEYAGGIMQNSVD